TAPPSTGRPSGGPTGSRSAPAGYRMVDDPAGFSLAVPDGYRRELRAPRVFYMSPGDVIRLGVREKKPERGGPAAELRRAHAEGPDSNPGYRDGKVTETVYHGGPAALWEFTWDGSSKEEGARHTVDLCWEEGGRMYDLWVSAPVGRSQEAKRQFDMALDTFVAAKTR
ncbi:serine/threonine protein kinase, partial [Streptomyces sp. T-3]|nr:serine/threonine protein kinase [Streptomyces sp. T-3]